MDWWCLSVSTSFVHIWLTLVLKFWNLLCNPAIPSLAVSSSTLYDTLQAHKCEVELQGAREQEQMLSEQVEQQDSILTQLQQELKAERERHSDTGRQLQQAKKNNIELQEDIDQYHKQVGDLSTTVNIVNCCIFISTDFCQIAKNDHFVNTYIVNSSFDD